MIFALILENYLQNKLQLMKRVRNTQVTEGDHTPLLKDSI